MVFTDKNKKWDKNYLSNNGTKVCQQNMCNPLNNLQI